MTETEQELNEEVKQCLLSWINSQGLDYFKKQYKTDKDYEEQTFYGYFTSQIIGYAWEVSQERSWTGKREWMEKNEDDFYDLVGDIAYDFGIKNIDEEEQKQDITHRGFRASTLNGLEFYSDDTDNIYVFGPRNLVMDLGLNEKIERFYKNYGDIAFQCLTIGNPPDEEERENEEGWPDDVSGEQILKEWKETFKGLDFVWSSTLIYYWEENYYKNNKIGEV